MHRETLQRMMIEFLVASQASKQLESRAAGRGIVARHLHLPAGLIHAIEADADATLCGTPRAELHVFPAFRFGRQDNRCSECTAAIEQAPRA